MKISSQDAFNELYCNYKERFLRFAQSYVHDVMIAEDIVVDAIVAYWESKDRLSDDINIPAYVLTTVKNKCLNYLKQQQVHNRIKDSIQSMKEWEITTQITSLEACEPYEVFSQEVQDIVEKTLANLSKRTREIFEMSRYENMTNKEIAEYYNISVKGVEFNITKVLKILRINLRDYLPSFIFLFFY